MNGIINDSQAAIAIGTLFGATAQEIREKANSSVAAQSRGERAAREESFTDALLHNMSVGIARHMKALCDGLALRGATTSIELAATNSPVVDETQFGIDVGIRLRMRTPTAHIVKGLLVQCKRMSPSNRRGAFLELRGRGEDQAKRMLRVTPAAVFMLFTFGHQSDLVDLATVPFSALCPMDNGSPIPEAKRDALGSACPYWGMTAGGIWDMGIAIIPAARVLAMSAAAAENRSPFECDAPTVLRGSLPIGVFVVDLLASCFVGDVRDDVVQLVTPPKLRTSPSEMVLQEGEPFAGFAVRHYLNIEVQLSE